MCLPLHAVLYIYLGSASTGFCSTCVHRMSVSLFVLSPRCICAVYMHMCIIVGAYGAPDTFVLSFPFPVKWHPTIAVRLLIHHACTRDTLAVCWNILTLSYSAGTFAVFRSTVVSRDVYTIFSLWKVFSSFACIQQVYASIFLCPYLFFWSVLCLLLHWIAPVPHPLECVCARQPLITFEKTLGENGTDG